MISNSCQMSEELSQEVLSLPMHPYLSDSEVEFISEQVAEGLEKL